MFVSSLDYYNHPSTIDYFNYILNGRWHTGLIPNKIGQIQMEELIINQLKINQKDRVLDFGSGTGLTTCDIQMMTDCQIIGANISNEQIILSNQLKDQLKLHDKVSFILISEKGQLPFPDHYFDKIVFFESICHVNNKSALLEEFHRILKPGGLLGGEDWMITNHCRQSEYHKYIVPICQTYKIPQLLSTNQFVLLLGQKKFQTITAIDLDKRYHLGSAFNINYFQQLSLMGLIFYLITYIYSYLCIKVKYGQILLDYPFKKDFEMNPQQTQNCAMVLHNAYQSKSFTIGFIVARK